MSSAVSGRYIPKPGEVTPRNKACQRAAVYVGLAGIALVGIAVIASSRSLNSRAAIGLAGVIVAAAVFRLHKYILYVSTQDSGPTGALKREFKRGDKSKFSQLLFFGANPNNPVRDHGMTLLHNAMDPDTVELLISYGADVNARSKFQDTPLHKAMEGSLDLDKKKVIKLLFWNGADPNAVNRSGSTPLGDAKRYRDSAVGSPIHSHWVEIVQLLSTQKG